MRLTWDGVPAGDALLVEGPKGSGKSVLATHFIAEGAIEGEPGVAFLFEEWPDRLIERAEAFDHPTGLKVAEPKVKPAAAAVGCLFDVPVIGAPTTRGEALAAAS